MFRDPNQLYCDGGVISANPSIIGGTWAVRLLEAGAVVLESSGVITPAQAKLPSITNNLTEMAALVKGLSLLPANWRGTIYSDSQVTLGRAFEGWKWNNIPACLYECFGKQAARLMHWKEIQYVLLDGHPTKAQLESGKGKRGHPVSEHNVWCDHACGQEAKNYLEDQAKVMDEILYGSPEDQPAVFLGKSPIRLAVEELSHEKA